MNTADLLIVMTVGLSSLVSLSRGFIRETLSLLTWLLACIIAWRYCHGLAPELAAWVDSPSLQLGVAFLLLFLAALLVGGTLGFILSRLMDTTGLSGTDRLLGMLFGTARGILLICVLVLLGELTPLPQENWWRESQWIAQARQLSDWLLVQMPPEIAHYFHLPGRTP